MTPMPQPELGQPIYTGQRIALLTHHGKERVIVPILDAALGGRVVHIGGYDANPTRMAMIGLAAEDLLRQIASRCPDCGPPGFVAVDRVIGLPCAECGEPTDQPLATVIGCVRCARREIQTILGAPSDNPSDCRACNP